jgi:hypothetical protein
MLLEGVIQRKGIPLALYSDRHGIFQRSLREPESLEEQLAGERHPTQFGRALRELAIQPIFALSPQAKGRIERLWATFQDRLVTELRLAGTTSREEANEVLRDFLPRFNARFSVPPVQPGLAYRQPPPGLCREGVLCFKYQRTVARDNTVRFGGRTLQLLPDLQRRSYAHARVEVQERMDGSLVLSYQGQVVATTEAPPHPVTLRARKGARSGTPAPSASLVVEVNGHCEAGSGPDPEGTRPQVGKTPSAHRPAPNHPWRRPVVTKSLNR